MERLKRIKPVRRPPNKRPLEQSLSAIDRLPPEIMSCIVMLVYKDGGATAVYNLCLVSKYMKALADPFKFRFVAVSGLAQVTALLRFLRRCPARAKEIHSLFLSESHPWFRRSEPRGLRKWFSFRRFLPKGPDFVESVARLIAKVRPTLQALTCVVDNWFPEDYGAILSLPFPCLTRLNFRSSWFRYHQDSKLENFLSPTFPALRSLHISTQHYLYHQNLCHLASLCQHCPQLEVLKLSGAWPDPDHFDSMWREFCDVEVRPETVVPITPLLPVTLRRVLVQNYHSDSDALGVMSETGQVVPRLPVTAENTVEGLLWLTPVNAPNFRERMLYAFDELHRGQLTGLGRIKPAQVHRVYRASAFEFLHVPIALTIGVYT